MKRFLWGLGMALALIAPGAQAHGSAVAEALAADGRWTRLVTTGEGPSVRSTPAVAPVLGSIYLFGGVKDDFASGENTFYDDLYRFDPRLARWTPLSPSGAKPPARAFAASAAVPARHWMLVFGGANYSADLSSLTFFDDLWAYSALLNRWTQLQPGNPGPSARSRPAMWVDGEKVYVFGGIQTDFHTLNDLWAFDLRTNLWTQIIANGDANSPTSRHEAAVAGRAWDGQLTLYGGQFSDSDGFVSLNDTWRFDLATHQWQNITPAEADKNVDAPRHQGSTVQIGHALLMAGGDLPGGSSGCGAAFPQNATSELWRFNLHDRTWRLLAPGGDAFPALKRTNAAAVGGVMYVFSGFGFSCQNDEGGQVWNPDVYAFRPR